MIGSEAIRAEEMAFAVPRIALNGDNPDVSLPQPLTPSDAALVRQVLGLQRRGQIDAASRLADAIQDPLLTGVILADRYLGRGYRSSIPELTAWLEQYTDLPDAPAIGALLRQRNPRASVQSAPTDTVGTRIVPAALGEEDLDAPDFNLPRNPALDSAVRLQAQIGNPTAALRLVASARTVSPAYAALLRAEVAQILFTRNEDTEALRIVIASLRLIGTDAQPGLTAYIGGLASWRLGRPDQARILFEESARAGHASARQRAASAFWAARAARRTGDTSTWVRWMQRAAAYSGTFHGLVARRALGLPTGIVPAGALAAEANLDAIASTPQGWRAFALLQVGETDRAAAELRALWAAPGTARALRQAVSTIAAGCGLTDLAIDLAAMREATNGRQANGLPMPRLRPAGGFSIDPALVYALTRTESNFNSQAVSEAGARGLMQIMPVTAQFIARNGALTAGRLHDPAINLALGQRYVNHLAQLDGVGDDLLRVLASYNAGPGNVLRWSGTLQDNDDPMLLIEAIPFAETRTFVPRVLTYSWVYAARLRLPAPSLDDLAAGTFPRFTSKPSKGTLAWTSSQPQ